MYQHEMSAKNKIFWEKALEKNPYLKGKWQQAKGAGFKENEDKFYSTWGDFSDCDLSDLDLSDLRVYDFKFINTNLKNSIMPSFVERVKFDGANLSGIKFDTPQHYSYYRYCNFNNANFEGSDLKFINLDRCELEKVNFSNSILTCISLQCTNLGNSNFVNSVIELCNFYRANLIGSDFTKSNIKFTGFNKAKIQGCKFKGATLKQVGLEDIDASFLFKDGLTLKE